LELKYLVRAGEDEIPELPMMVDDFVIRGLVEHKCLEENATSDPAKVIAAIDCFLGIAMGRSVAQKGTGTRQ